MCRISFLLLLYLLCMYSNKMESAKILGVFPIPSVSHQVVFQPIWKELSLKGHEVTVITTNPLNDPTLINLTEINMGFTYEVYRKKVQDFHGARFLTQLVEKVYSAFGATIEEELSHPTVQLLLQDKSREYDLVIVEFIHPTVYAFSAKFNCPLIGIASISGLLSTHDAVGNPSHPVLNPDFFFPYHGELSFFERLYSTYFAIWYRYYYYYHVLPKEDQLVKRYIDENLPYLGDIEKNVSLLLLNTNPILHSIRPNVPAIIQFGGVHIQETKHLPPELQKELDSATNGAVYFSLGSNIRSANLSEELRKIIVDALSELPYKVLWKWEEDHLPNKPQNVVIKKWLPQQDILGHPNVKVFLTQGGLQSLEEAIANSVPLVAMPFLGDQPLNARKIVNLGMGLSVNPKTVTKKELKNALLEVAANPRYRAKVKDISNLLSDEPMTGLEKAVWWIEYVIRHKGAKHLRSPSVDISWCLYLLLDVISFVVFIALVFAFILYNGIKILVKVLKYLKNTKKKVA